MKRLLLFALLLGILPVNSFGKKVDRETAAVVANNFMLSKASALANHPSPGLRLIYQEMATGTLTPQSDALPIFYVFSSDSSGYVIISGDDKMSPVLSYSTTGHFDMSDVPPALSQWLESYKQQILWLINNNVATDYSNAGQWEDLKNNTVRNPAKARAVDPLITTKWSQSPYYNALCPGGCVTGCVATAMAQVMKYWNYPATGTGSHSYYHPTYGTLSADFGSTTYKWDRMPMRVESPNSSVALLMYHAGVGADMNYSPGLSGASILNAEYALETHFGYSSSMRWLERDDYSPDEWLNILKTELDEGRPVLYVGNGDGGGHAFIADGYDNNSMFHMNWGWGGSCDGFVLLTDIDPGNGGGGFNSNQEVIVGIKPSENPQNIDIVLSDNVTPEYSMIGYNQPLCISTNVVNNGTGTFTGEFRAAVFDTRDNLIGFVETLQASPLEGGSAYADNLVFYNSLIPGLMPGEYTVRIFCRPSGGTWILVGDNGSYTNAAGITVVNGNFIELYSDINIAQGTTLVQGSPANVTFNILNDGPTTFIGTYLVDLFNLNGEPVQSLGDYYEPGLPPDNIYEEPYLTFSANSIDVAPGTYYMTVTHRRGYGQRELTGSSYYKNPVVVTVVAPTLQPDPYEANNTPETAYTLTADYINGYATVSTQGSNCHDASDTDFYRISMPEGFSYTVTLRLNDSYYNSNGNTYTLDGLFSLSADGINWTETYDDVPPDNFVLFNGGTLYIQVAPYYAGQTASGQASKYLAGQTGTDYSGQTGTYASQAGTNYAGQEGMDYSGQTGMDYSDQTGTFYSDQTGMYDSGQAGLYNFGQTGKYYSGQAGKLYSDQADKYYTGQTGTYLFELEIIRTDNLGLAEDPQHKSIKTYPNPTNGECYIDLRNYEGTISEIQLLNIAGKQLLTMRPSTPQIISLPLSAYSAGMYLVKLITTEGVLTRKVVVR